MSRNNGVPPAPPTLGILESAPSSITLSWTPPALDGGSPLIAYRLHYHREFGDWERVEISPEQNSYSLHQLKCGTKYQFYIHAVNDFGAGERTETIPASTAGSAPIAPDSTNEIIASVNSTSIAVDLNSWIDGGCRISSFVIEYRHDLYYRIL